MWFREKLNFPNIENLDQKQLEWSPGLLRAIRRFNLNFLSAQPQTLVARLNTKAPLQSDSYKLHTATLDAPSIILEHSASFCSFLVAVDQLGQVLSLHEPLVKSSLAGVKSSLYESGYLTAVQEILHGEVCFLLFATTTTTLLRNQLLTQLEEILSKKVEYFFTSQTSPDFISDLVIIPSFLAKSGKVELILPYLLGNKRFVGEETQRVLKYSLSHWQR